MLFKVDFEKAFDSISFLDSTMSQMGFPALWRKWIMGILSSARSSVLVNGSPTKEFKIERGVRQGDPLSPLLFILAMEALHVATITANVIGIFKGCKTPNNGPTISHLLYADDVLFVGEWSDSNLHNLSRLLRCFNLSSGLKVNFNKSQLFGVGVPLSMVEQKASILHCKTGVFPFFYLGLPIGSNMGLVKNWKPIIDKFEEKLTLWKARTLSFGGRVTLIETVLGNLPTYYLSLFCAPIHVLKHLKRIRREFLWGGCMEKNKVSWVPWYKVIVPKNNGGLGIGSLASTNKALMIKWAVRYKNEPSSLWASTITAIHGGSRCRSYIPLKSSIGGVWKSVVNMGRISQNHSVNVQERLTPVIGKGDKTLFWLDNWVGGSPLRVRYPNLYALESNKRCTVSERCKLHQGVTEWLWGSNNTLINEDLAAEWVECTTLLDNVTIQPKADVWLWRSGSEVADFLVSTVREELDHINTLNETKVLRWLHWIPKKVNCFLWRAVLDRIATREALHSWHIPLPSTSCVLCNNSREFDRLLISCDATQQVWTLIFQWLKIPLPGFILSVVQLLELIHSDTCPKIKKRSTYVVVAATCWCIWLMRNDIIFKQKTFSMTKLVGDIKAISYSWIKNRAGLSEINWEKWRSFNF
ncbi:putative RNA-directed DNA polymerase [Helianthus annuus]|uniref:RNA-directed DNA polymerase n=1 Tax=Helianthus annuus TaxID=4232 RepID=A0A9K3HW48_HELAN|nr:putative RNA-directed DNA polymerase [Helianthus annuus]KAJ0513150.1 putative RNA-directed DNA polymerase [Helianthus annuus]KAJ0529274.1 putative RNA-directed DNA polymerase [Helianthus annuus]KAJ0696156.1 putative RNA-directed DNA polymerase [Helianthus annuus]